MKNNLTLLRSIALFQDFKENPEALGKIDRLFTERTVRRGETIFREGKEGDELYIIKKGSVRVQKKTLQNEPYTVVTLTADQHAFFGEMGLLLNDKRSASVVAEQNCVFLVTNRRKFVDFGEREPHAALLVTRQIARILARRLRKTNEDVVTLFSALVDEIENARAGE